MSAKKTLLLSLVLALIIPLYTNYLLYPILPSGYKLGDDPRRPYGGYWYTKVSTPILFLLPFFVQPGSLNYRPDGVLPPIGVIFPPKLTTSEYLTSVLFNLIVPYLINIFCVFLVLSVIVRLKAISSKFKNF